MPKTTAPLLSFDARGQIAKTQVYSSWKGIPYARRYAVPANPRTVKQTANRKIWQLLGQMWLYAPAGVLAAFSDFAVGKPLTGRNKFFSDNQKLLATQPTAEDLAGFIFSPGSRGGLPPASLSLSAGADQVTATIGLPTVPNGWTLVASHLAAVKNQDPTDAFEGIFKANRQTTTPGTNVLTGLTGEVPYVCGAFLEWQRPDGLTAYSVSLSAVATPT